MRNILAGIFTPSGRMGILSKGVGVIDVAGGGFIHCMAGTVTLVLLYFSSLGPTYGVTTCENVPQQQISAILELLGTLLMWLAFVGLHVVVTSDWKQADVLYAGETVWSLF